MMDNIFRTVKKTFGLGGPSPINTLDRSNVSRTRPTSSSACDSAERLSKKRRLRDEDEAAASSFTSAHFRIQGSPESSLHRRDSISDTQSRSDTRGPPSIHSGSHKANLATNVGEFRSAEKRIQAPKNKRPRHRGLSSSQNLDAARAMIEVLSDGDDVEPKHPQNRERHEQVDLEILGARFGRSKRQLPTSPGSGVKRKAAREASGLAKRPRTSSPDPLHEATDRSPGAGNNRPVQSVSSVSTRGDIKRTNFKSAVKLAPKHAGQSSHKGNTLPAEVRARQIIPSPGLKVVRGVSGDLAYPGEDPARTIEFNLGIIDISTLLLPIGADGQLVPEYSYMIFDLHRAHVIKYSPDSTIVAIRRAADPGKSAGASLHLQFGTRKQAALFIEWVRMERDQILTVKLEDAQAVLLEREMSNLYPKATKSRVLTDERVPQADLPEDVQLIQYNQAHRTRQARVIDEEGGGQSDRLSSRRKMNGSTRPQNTGSQGDPSSPTTHSITSSGPGGPQTRSSRMPRRPRSPTPKGWTDDNPDWATGWRNSLIFPAQGKDRATVDKEDIPRLDEGQYLNDNLIIFALRYMQDHLEKATPERAQRIHFHNTFFYEKLKPTKSSAGINYSSVKSWTSKVDLFTKDFIVVPINEFSHWYVAIIYNAPKLLQGALAPSAEGRNVSSDQEAAVESSSAERSELQPDMTAKVETDLQDMSISDDPSTGTALGTVSPESGNEVRPNEREPEIEEVKRSPAANRKRPAKKMTMPRKYDPSQPRIITLDSLGSAHSPACQHLRHYLVAELKDKKGLEIEDPGALGMTAKPIPEQHNFCDCGVFLLGYILNFIENPDSFIRNLLHHEKPTWDVDPADLRRKLREIIFGLQREQIEREDATAEEKRRKRERATQRRPDESDRISSNEEGSHGEQPPTTTASKSVMEPSDEEPREVAAPNPSNAYYYPGHLASNPGAKKGLVGCGPKDSSNELDASVVSSVEQDLPEATRRSDSNSTDGNATPNGIPSSTTARIGSRSPINMRSGSARDLKTDTETENEFLELLPTSPPRSGTSKNPLSLDDSMERASTPTRSQGRRAPNHQLTNIEIVIPTMQRHKGARGSMSASLAQPQEDGVRGPGIAVTSGEKTMAHGRRTRADADDRPIVIPDE